MSEEIRQSLHDYFVGLHEHAYPQAKRYIRNVTETRDDDDKVVELPTAWSKQSVYARWMVERGWKLKTDNKGRNKVIEDPNFDGNERLGYVSWPSFHNFWKKNHRNLVLPKP